MHFLRKMANPANPSYGQIIATCAITDECTGGPDGAKNFDDVLTHNKEKFDSILANTALSADEKIASVRALFGFLAAILEEACGKVCTAFPFSKTGPRRLARVEGMQKWTDDAVRNAVRLTEKHLTNAAETASRGGMPRPFFGYMYTAFHKKMLELFDEVRTVSCYTELNVPDGCIIGLEHMYEEMMESKRARAEEMRRGGRPRRAVAPPKRLGR